MSCGLALAAALLVSDPSGVVQPPAPPPHTLAEEPLYADIVSRSQALKAIVDAGLAGGAAAAADGAGRADCPAFGRAAARVAARDMAGHVDLRERNTDGDLRCILRGLSEDLPQRVDALATAETSNARADALAELSYLLRDNVEVVTAPPQPETAQ